MSENPPTLKELLDPANIHYDFPLKDKDARVKECVLYVADACVSDSTYSKIKLLKILFHADFESYGMYLQPITGTPYRKLPYGPAPREFLRIQDEMIRDRLIHVHRQRVHDFTSQRLLPLMDPTFVYLTARDTSILNRWIQFFWNKSAREVSEYSHGRAWKIAKDGALIPYEAVFISDDPVTFEEAAMVRELAAKYGWKI